jgi:hypothetical protein
VIGYPEALILAVVGLLLAAAFLSREDPDHGDARHAGKNTLREIRRREMCAGWDNDATGAGPGGAQP